MLRRYGTDASQRVTAVETPDGDEEISKTAAQKEWTDEDEGDLLRESED